MQYFFQRMRGLSAATVMEERLRNLLTGAMEKVLPLINVQELEEELNREPEVVGGESWKKWEQIVLTRLLFRMAEVVALQNLRQECWSTEEGKEQLNSDSDKGKRKQEGGEEGGGKRQKKDLQESEVVRENDPVSPSLLPGNVSGQLELDEDDQELVEVLAQMAEQASSTTLAPLDGDCSNRNEEGGTVQMATPCLNKSPGKTPSANISRSSTRESGVFKENNPAPVSRTTSTPLVQAQSGIGGGNRNLTTDLVSRPQSEGEKLLPKRTISMPASTSEPWWATRKVRLKSKVSTGSSPIQTLPEVEKEKRVGNGKGEGIGNSDNFTRAETTRCNGHNIGVAGVLKSSDALGEKSKGNVSGVEESGENQEESEGKQGGTDGEQADRERNPGESGSKGWDTGGGRPGKSRAARRAEKRKLKREEVPS